MMLKLSVALVLVILVRVTTQSESKLCITVSTIDCEDQYTEEGDESVCGTDGKTYNNRCFFAQAKCLNNELEMACHGNCSVCFTAKNGEAKNNDQQKTTPTIKTSPKSTTAKYAGNSDVTTQVYNDHKTMSNGHVVRQINRDTNDTANLREHLINERNISRTRKHLPGHHVDTNSEFTTEGEPNTNAFQYVTTDNKMKVEKSEYSRCYGLNCNHGQTKNPGTLSSNIPPATKSLLMEIVTQLHVTQFNEEKVTGLNNEKMFPKTTPLPVVQEKQTTLIDILHNTQTAENEGLLTTKMIGQTTLPTSKAKQKEYHSTLITKLLNPIALVVNGQTANTNGYTETTKPGTSETNQGIFRPHRAITTQEAPVTSHFTDDVFFCKTAETSVCPKTLDPLCGTDDKFYLNICTFKKAKCKDPLLQLQDDLSACRETEN